MQPKHDVHAPYTLYKSDISYFSGKLEAYLKYKQIPYEAIDIDYFNLNDIAFSTGTKKVPAVKTADNLWLHDTTPMIQWFESQYPNNPVLPEEPSMGFLALLIEDYADEWLWRPAMWWRWVPKASRLSVGWGLGQELFGRFVARPVGWYFGFRQLREWLWNDGVDKQNETAVKDMLFREFDFLEALLEEQPFIMGSHPSVADLGYFASMFRHFGNDPVSAEVMRREAPNTYEWTARVWNLKAHKLSSSINWIWPTAEYWQPLLGRIMNDYLPYLEQNAIAWQNGQARFDYQGKSVSFKKTKTTHYRVFCLEVLKKEFAKLELQEQNKLYDLFSPYGDIEAFFKRKTIESGLTEQIKQLRDPVTDPAPKPTLKALLFGQPRN